jgi:hypothetical protein
MAHERAMAAGHKAAITRARRVAKAKKTHTPIVTGKSLAISARRAIAPRSFASGDWIMAYNDEADTCVAAAIANSCLVLTGRYLPSGTLLALAKYTEGATIVQGLVTAYQLGLCRGFAPVYPIRTLGLIFGLRVPEGPHAVTVGLRGLITWGSEVQLQDYVVEEAWLIDWPAKERA